MEENLKYIEYHFEKDTGIIYIWLNRPNKGNAFNSQMALEIVQVFDFVVKIEGAKAILLAGRGSTFCSGADLLWMRDACRTSRDENDAQARLLASVFDAVFRCPLPVIALVHGKIMGGGLGVLAACDVVFADVNATFCLPEVRIGLSPSTIMPYLLNRMNLSAVRKLAYFAEPIGANSALDLGLIDACHSSEEVVIEALNFVKTVVKGQRFALEEVKRLSCSLTKTGSITPKAINESVKSIVELREKSEVLDLLNQRIAALSKK